MAEEKQTRVEERAPQAAARGEATRSTPRTGAEEHAAKRDRTSELPANEAASEDLQDRIEAANETANQTIDEGNENEVEGKLAVPRVEVMKRGSTKYTDEDGRLVKTLNDAQPNAPIAEEEVPDYLKLHQAVLEGADALDETLKYQGRKPEEGFAEGKLANAEEHPRTGGIGVAAARPENQQRKADDERK